MHYLPIQKNKKGFTLVETLVAIAVLLIVIVGPMGIAQKGIQNAYYANEQVTAVFLAQEAIEAVRMYRDNQALAAYDEYSNSVTPRFFDTSDWIPSACSSSQECAYDKVGNNFGVCTDYNMCKLKQDTDGQYQHDTGADSPFTRKVIFGLAVDGGVPVTVDVSWNSNILGSRHVILQTWIYDHYQRYENP